MQNTAIREVNPFINSLYVPYIENIVDIIDGKPISYKVEQDRYVRLYVSKEKREFIFSHLSMYARDMMLTIQYLISPNYQYVFIPYERLVELYKLDKYGKRRYEDTIRELHRYSIIDCRNKAEACYWYNPVYFAAGNRIDMYPESAVKVATHYNRRYTK